MSHDGIESRVLELESVRVSRAKLDLAPNALVVCDTCCRSNEVRAPVDSNDGASKPGSTSDRPGCDSGTTAYI
jgi:hypothetical protein